MSGSFTLEPNRFICIRSEDGGDSWEELKSLVEMPEEVKYKWYFPQPPHQGHVRHIYIDPENRQMPSISPSSMAVSYAAFDRGQTWEDVSDGFEYPDIHMVVRSPSSKTKYFAATSRGFFSGRSSGKRLEARRKRDGERLLS